MFSPGRSTTIITLLILFATSALSNKFNICIYVTKKDGTLGVNHPNSLQCRVCGPITGSYNAYCFAYNETYNALLPDTPLKTPNNRATWTNLTVAAPDPQNPIVPSSNSRYVRSTHPSSPIFMDFTPPYTIDLGDNYTIPFWTYGVLESFSFACANATDKSNVVPAACTLNVTSACMPDSEDLPPEGVPEVVVDVLSLAYVPPVGAKVAGMQRAEWVPVPFASSSVRCYNFTFEATMGDGRHARLYLDDVLYRGIWHRD